MRRHLLVLLAGLALTVAACGDSDVRATEGPSTGDSSLPEETMPTVPEEEASLLVLLNSEERGEIGVRIEVDGGVAFDQTFQSSSGHNTQQVPLDLEPGAHRIFVEATDGTTLDLPLDLPDEKRFLILTYGPAGTNGDPPNSRTEFFDHELTARPPQFG